MNDQRRGLRGLLAAEAARLMYEEQIKEYFTAKRMAAKRLGATSSRFRPHDLPSNGEIRDALLSLAARAEGAHRHVQLFAMRVVALRTMRALDPLHPRLIGSVSTGHVRRGSDIDIQVFSDDEQQVERLLEDLHWRYERQETTLRKFGEIRVYVHYHLVDVFAIELTRYETRELRFRARSSTDGKPIRRVRANALEALMAAEHTQAWAIYQQQGVIPGLDQWLQRNAAPAPGPFDGLLEEGNPLETPWSWDETRRSPCATQSPEDSNGRPETALVPQRAGARGGGCP